jgi:hypothetical protein
MEKKESQGQRPAVTEMRARAQELVKRIGLEMYREAYESGETLSAHLERLMPYSDYQDGLDAFQRALMLNDLRIRSVDGEQGVWASKFEDFFKNEQRRALLPEWWRREYKRGQGLPVNTRSLFLSQDGVPGSLLNPWTDQQTPRVNKMIAPQIPLAELVAITTPVDSDAYRALYMTDDAAAQRMVRVTEASDIPVTKITQGENTIRLSKFGRALEMSYEMLRRYRIDRVAYLIQRMAVQAEIDKVDAVTDVLVSGDGNSNTAAINHNLTALDGAAVAGTLTLKGYLAYKLKFLNPYALTHVLVQEATGLQLLLLNTGSANVPTTQLPAPAVQGITSFEVINPTLKEGTRLGVLSSAPTLKIVGFDARYCIERVAEVGATIQEVERIIRNQTQLVTMTETEGYAKMDQNACRTLDVNA